jgi:FKBP-type peptidyl-prolyl cis-trans isomerase 2
MDILNPADLAKVYIEPTPADGTWHAQQIKALAEIYPQIGEVLERVREAKVTLEFNRRVAGRAVFFNGK